MIYSLLSELTQFRKYSRYDLEIYDSSSKKKKKSLLIGYGIEDIQSDEVPFKSSSSLSDISISPSDYHISGGISSLSSPELIHELRKKFKRKDTMRDIIEVDVIILTHPLKDPGLLMNLFKNDSDYVRHLYLTGLPESYYQQKNKQFFNWLKERSLKHTIIHFLALQKFTVDFLGTPETRKYKGSYFTSLVNEGEQSLSLGDVKVSVLAMNPTHCKGRRKTFLRMSTPEDIYSDSLVLKITHGSSSVILGASATNLTTDRVLNNYFDKPEALQSSVLVVSRYGSTLQGANNKTWLEKINPEYVIVGHGSQPTFEHDVYKTLQTLPRLKNSLTPHEIEIQVPEVQTHSVSTGIFSTLKSGTITIDLYKKHLIFKTEKERDIEDFNAPRSLEKNKTLQSRSPSLISPTKSLSKISCEKTFRDSSSDVSYSPQIRKIRKVSVPRPQSSSVIKNKHHEMTSSSRKDKQKNGMVCL